MPKDCSKGTKRKVFWKCKKEHSYIASVNHRVNGTGCPYCSSQISKGETEWLDFLEVSSGPIMRQHRVEGTKSSLDGAQPEKMLGFFYHGDYYHGHPRFPRDSVNPTNKKPFGELYEATIRTEEFFRTAGYTLHVMWEFDWNRAKKAVKNIQRKWRKHHFQT